MNILIPILYILEVLVSLLLVGLVLLQKSKESGVVAMGGGMGEAIFGAQVGTFLMKATIVLGVVFLVNTLAISVLLSNGLGRSAVRGHSAPVDTPVETVP